MNQKGLLNGAPNRQERANDPIVIISIFLYLCWVPKIKETGWGAEFGHLRRKGEGGREEEHRFKLRSRTRMQGQRIVERGGIKGTLVSIALNCPS